MSIEATFRDMGLRSEKAVAHHLLIENAYDSNLLPNISNVDYLAGNLGQTNLQPLAGLPPFVDDIYVFGYMHRSHFVQKGHRIFCTTDENGSAKNIISRIAIAAREAFGTARDGTKNPHMQTNIVHTIAAKKDTEGGKIRATISSIESRKSSGVRKAWETIYPGKEPEGIFVAKVDVSEIPLEELQEGLPSFERLLLANGNGIFSIDCTQDFSGTLDRNALVDFLRIEKGFREKGSFAASIADGEDTILDNTDSVGNNCCTWVGATNYGCIARNKIYNKIVSNFEAGEVRSQFGGHLAEYADCPNKHLRRTFLHPDVQARGCTRIETSLYACDQEELPVEKVLQEVFSLVSKPAENEGLFVVQPPTKQWENLAKSLDRCLVLADRPQNTIWVGWYANTQTRRICGVRIQPPAANMTEDAVWNKTVEWAAADFGFRACPIFRLDIVGVNEEGVEMAPLRAYTKGANSNTVLAANRKPTQLHPNGADISAILPPSKTVSWVWRTKKCHALGRNKSVFDLQETPEIAREQEVYNLSTRNREKRIQEIWEAAQEENWRKKVLFSFEEEKKKQQESEEHRKKQLEKIADIVEANERYLELSKQISIQVKHKLAEYKTEKIANLCPPNQIWKILGYRRQKNKQSKPRVVLRLQRTKQESRTEVVWANQKLDKILGACEQFFESAEDSYERTTFWIVSKGQDLLRGLQIRVQPSESFQAQDGQKVVYNPIEIVSSPDPKRTASLRLLAEETDKKLSEIPDIINPLHEITPPKPKEIKKTLEIPEGEYVCRHFAHTTFRNKPRTILFLQSLGEDREPTTDEETPVWGFFLQRELEAFGGLGELRRRKTQLFCTVGCERTTPQKKKDRLVVLS